MNLPKGKKLLRIVSAAMLAVSPLAGLVFSSVANAATGSLTDVEVRFNNMKAGQFTSGTVCAIPDAAAGTVAQVQVTFPTNFTVDTTLTDWTVSTTNTAWPVTPASVNPLTPAATNWPGIAQATAAAGQVVTFPSGPLTAGTLYCFNWTNTTAALKQPATSSPNTELGSVTTQTSAPATVDTAQYATATLSDDTINVTATVPPYFMFALNVNSDALGTLTTGAPQETSGTKPTLTVNTNAKNGFQVWGSDNNTGLKSTQAGYTIASHTGTLTSGQEFYNTGVFSKSQVGGAGTMTIGTGFDDTSDNKTGVGLTPALQTVATSTGTADTAVLTLVNNVVIKATTPAATDYSDLQTYVAAGLF